ncbi:MAG TPA: hypothetical protein ENK04_00870 [Gammaproteobacteria bacterium]|nr:hypothetical protein [Gammaproteobacteria bacterium]
MKYSVNIFILISLLISGCGGGGNSTPNLSVGGLPTDTSIDFKLFPDNYFTNYDVSAALTGADNQGRTYTGNTTEKTLNETVFLGDPAIPVQTDMVFTISNGGFGAASLTSYYSVDAGDRRFLGSRNNNVETVSATTTPIPETANIGDAGVIGTYIDNSNAETSLSWKLEDGFNGNAKLVLSNVTNDQSGVLDNTFTTTYLIKPDGSRLSVELKTFNANINTEVTLTGNY